MSWARVSDGVAVAAREPLKVSLVFWRRSKG